MIQAKLQSDCSYVITMDIPDRIVLRRLSDAYGILPKAMLVACINKGIEVIGKQVSRVDKHDGSTDDHSQDDSGG